MSKAITLTITEDEIAELETLLDQYRAEAEKDEGELAQHLPQFDPNLSDRARFEAMLGVYLAKARQSRDSHERTMALVDERLERINLRHQQTRALLGEKCEG